MSGPIFTLPCKKLDKVLQLPAYLKKSDYTPKIKENDGMIDSITSDEINEFLTRFFKLYPLATEKKLSYYVVIEF